MDIEVNELALLIDRLEFEKKFIAADRDRWMRLAEERQKLAEAIADSVQKYGWWSQEADDAIRAFKKAGGQ